MGKNFRETLAEQLKDPEFKKVWDAGTAERERSRLLLLETTLTREESKQKYTGVDASSGMIEGLKVALANEK